MHDAVSRRRRLDVGRRRLEGVDVAVTTMGPPLVTELLRIHHALVPAKEPAADMSQPTYRAFASTPSDG